MPVCAHLLHLHRSLPRAAPRPPLATRQPPIRPDGRLSLPTNGSCCVCVLCCVVRFVFVFCAGVCVCVCVSEGWGWVWVWVWVLGRCVMFLVDGGCRAHFLKPSTK